MTGDFERVSSDDLMSLATDRGTMPMQVGAILVLDTGPGCDSAELIAAVARRVPAISRLRQRLVRPSFFLGRPFWVDDPRFRIEDHVSVAYSQKPPGMDELLAIASELVTTRLPENRPLWAALLVPDIGGGRTGLIVVFHHVVADGIAGLAILAALADGSAGVPARNFPEHPPIPALLALDTVRDRILAIGRFPNSVRRVLQAVAQLGPSFRTRAARSSLNQPVGAIQRIVTIDCDLAAIRDVAHASHGTVNDIVLSSITGALQQLLRKRGEFLGEFVISVPFSSRRNASSESLGNRSGAVPIRLPATGSAFDRLRATIDITTVEKRTAHGASTALLGPIFRGLATLGLYQWFIDRQRTVHTFVTNLRGPPSALSLGGVPIVGIVPLTVAVGNIAISFAVLSYAGRLTITITSDRAAFPDLEVLRDALESEITALTG